MRKTINLTFAMLFASFVANAFPISYQQAQKLAELQLASLRPDRIAAEGVRLTSNAKGRQTQKNDSPTYYMFNASDGKGFVLVSGDDQFPTIIGYSDNGTIAADAELPEGLKQYLEAYDQYVTDVRNGKVEAPNMSRHLEKGESMGTPVVAPLLTTVWTQEAPFNLLCPKSSGGKLTPVGCVALAMAQIMNYWKWPTQGKGYYSYSSEFGTLSSDFSAHTYDWSLLTDTIILSSPKATRDLAAQICYDCGIATKMQYGTNGSGTASDLVMNALYTYFGYRASTLRYYLRSCLNSDQEWLDLIKTELDAGRPITMSGMGATNEGHCFVADGYDSNDYIHINWGWSGRYNGYFDAVILNPGSYNYSLEADILVGIEPNRTGIEEKRSQVPLTIIDKPHTIWSQRKVTQFFIVSVDTILNYTYTGRSYSLTVGLFDMNDNYVGDVRMNAEPNSAYINGWYYEHNMGRVTCKFSDSIRSVITDGDYTLRFLCKEGGYDEWIFPDIVGGSQRNAIPVYIHDGVMDFNQYSAAIAGVTLDETRKNKSVYNLLGQRLGNLNRGLNIVDDKKIWVR